MFAQDYAATRQAQVDALFASPYGEALRAGRIEVDLTLPAGVAVTASPCSCRSDECFFCGAEITAMEVVEADEYWAEIDARYGGYWEG